MSAAGDRRRGREAVLFGVVAALVLAIGVGALWRDLARDEAPDLSGSVFPDFAGREEAAGEIRIAAADREILLRREGEGWVLPERGGHPADRERATRLLAFVAGLEYRGARTRLPARHERLSLGDPAEGGGGMRLTVLARDGREMADLIVGAAASDSAVYIRAPGDNQSFAASGARPEMGELADWMGLDFLGLGNEAIARVRVRPETGPAYLLERGGMSVRNFSLRDPLGWRPLSEGAGNGVGAALARLRFRDARPAADFPDPPVARHEAETWLGLRVTLDVYAEGEARWTTIAARALAADAEDEALALNARAEGWAFLLSDLSIERLIRPLSGFAEPPRRIEPEPEAEP